MVPVTKIPIENILQGEWDENLIRKDFSFTELKAIRDRLESELGERRGRPDNSVKLTQFQGEKTRDVVARLGSVGARTLEKAGELRVAEALQESGFHAIRLQGMVYTSDGLPVIPSDILALGKGMALWVQVKHKEPRKHYPDTGLETWRFDRLKKLASLSGLPALPCSLIQVIRSMVTGCRISQPLR